MLIVSLFFFCWSWLYHCFVFAFVQSVNFFSWSFHICLGCLHSVSLFLWRVFVLCYLVLIIFLVLVCFPFILLLLPVVHTFSSPSFPSCVQPMFFILSFLIFSQLFSAHFPLCSPHFPYVLLISPMLFLFPLCPPHLSLCSAHFPLCPHLSRYSPHLFLCFPRLFLVLLPFPLCPEVVPNFSCCTITIFCLFFSALGYCFSSVVSVCG